MFLMAKIRKNAASYTKGSSAVLYYFAFLIFCSAINDKT
jgi:hypothetical protein